MPAAVWTIGTHWIMLIGRLSADVVTAAQVQALPVLEGYVALAGDLPVARVKLPYQAFDEKASAFVDSE